MNTLEPDNQPREAKPEVLSAHPAVELESKPHPEEVVDEITVWWRKALGKTSVLGMASNRAARHP